MKQLIDTLAGQRPLRTVVDRMGFAVVTAAVESVNRTSERATSEVMAAMGLAHATELKRAKPQPVV